MVFLFVKLESILQWRRDAKKSVWMKVPISQSYLIPVAFFHGFNYHHAIGNYAMLLKWLPQQITCTVPPYASHQIGVAGIGVFKLILLLGCCSWPASSKKSIQWCVCFRYGPQWRKEWGLSYSGQASGYSTSAKTFPYTIVFFKKVSYTQ